MPFCYSPDDASAFYSVPPLVQPVDFMTRGSYSSWGWRISGYGVLCAAVVSFLRVVIVFPCGVRMELPASSAQPHPCSFDPFIYLILTVATAIEYWPILLGIVFGPPFIGYWLDRRRQASA
jgi:hypothetical protein